ncbi:MAG: transketolase family protein [Actinomycetota bacterium]
MIADNIKEMLATEDTKIATRAAYGKKLAELGKINEDIVVLDCDLSKSTKTSVFAEKFPHRFFNFGIAEANMMSAAAGLATMGKIPFASTFGVFASKRAADQVSISVAYPRLNVKICATHTGITVGEDGATHQAIEDVAIMRSIPNIAVISPADATETERVLEEILKIDGPCYVRLCRGSAPVIFNHNYRFQLGKGVKIYQGDAATIVAAGFTTHIAMKAAQQLEQEGIEVDLINMSSIKPIDSALLAESAQKTGLVITVEDHNIIGGLGSAVCEALSEASPAKVIRLGVADKFGASGTAEELIEAYGFGKDNIMDAVKENIG